MIQKEVMDFICATGLVKYRFVVVDKVTDIVTYCPAGEKPDGITVGDEDNLKIAVQLLGNLNASFWFDATGVIARGDEIQVGANGTGIKQTSGAIACYAKIAAVSGAWCVGYNVFGLPMSEVGTPANGVTALEEGVGAFHKTTLTVDSALGAIAGGAALGLGKLVYTLPAGAKVVKVAYMSMALTAVDGNIDADTPDGGIGNVVASGANATLDACPAGSEVILTGQTFNNCTGTAEVKTVADQILVIETGDAHTIYFNVADTWAASGETACPIAGTIVIEWYDAD